MRAGQPRLPASPRSLLRSRACSRAKPLANFSRHLSKRKALSTMNKPIKPVEALIPLEQAAKILNISKKTLWRRIKAGELAVIRDGNIISVMPDDLKSYMAKRRIA